MSRRTEYFPVENVLRSFPLSQINNALGRHAGHFGACRRGSGGDVGRQDDVIEILELYLCFAVAGNGRLAFEHIQCGSKNSLLL